MRISMAAGTVAFVTALALSAPPAMAAPTEWTMPNMRNMNLAAAQEAFTEATAGGGPKLVYRNDTGPGEVTNLTNWTVCGQFPSAGATLTKKSYALVAVNRPNKC